MTTHLGPLKPGARVALVATSGPSPDKQINRSIELLTRWGLVPVLAEHLTDAHPRASYLAGPDASRAADLQAAWCDPGIDAVFCIRGGYGSVRILDLLDIAALQAAKPKPLYGSSDVTAVHEFWFEQLGAATWFTPMLATGALLKDEAAQTSLHASIFEPWEGREYRGDASASIVPGVATGTLVGGNLSLLAMTLGATGRRPRPPGAYIGLLEDVTEETYRIDGFLMSMLRSGWFEGMTGIALGSWLKCGKLSKIRSLVEELLEPLDIPLVWQLGFGHDDGAHSVPIGAPATLYSDEDSRLVLGATAP